LPRPLTGEAVAGGGSGKDGATCVISGGDKATQRKVVLVEFIIVYCGIVANSIGHLVFKDVQSLFWGVCCISNVAIGR